ncbi:slit homolog 1 protein-like [Gigantopelta aegis]|uniref:slit homolog 1 protein-like n=1 Tax=Gigantopelta aegis TaxID=1735272 RepID=UPI001B88B9B6|nr:slit homolog 1 protein-like [Gigantopelta aegis]
MEVLKCQSAFTVVVFLLTLSPHTVSCLPEGCVQTGNDLACPNLQSFPRPFASDATSLNIYNANLKDIPAAAFRDMPNIEVISISNTQIGTIKGCAFGAKTNMKTLTLYSCVIGTVESYAFCNITGQRESSMSLYLTTIKTIQPHAFSNVKGFNQLSIYSINITSIESYAFDNLELRTSFSLYLANIDSISAGAFQDIKSVISIYSSNISAVGCYTFDKLHDYDHSFQLRSLRFNCDCSFAWLLKYLKSTPKFQTKDVTCFAPASLQNSTFTNLTVEQLCPGSSPSMCDASGVKPPVVTDIRCGTTVLAGSTTNMVCLMLLFIYKQELF